MFQDNNWYGHRKIFLDYCNIKKNYPSFASIQHGWCVFDIRKTLGRRKFKKYIPFLCWSSGVKKILTKNNSINSHIVGSPFIYLHKMLKKKKLGNGVLVFPSHSTPEVKVVINHKKLIKEVEKDENPPFTVCLYYTDYKPSIIKLYKKKKWKVVCCGSRSDEKFLFKLYDHILSARKVICTELTSPLFYSMYLNKKTRILNQYISKNNKFYFSKVKMWKFEVSTYNFFYKNYPKLFKKGIDLKSAKKLANNELGLKYLKSKDYIKKVMGWNSYFKIFLSFLISKFIDLKNSKNLRIGKSNISKMSPKKYNQILNTN